MSAEITNVIADSPAWHHGVKAGDILVSVNGHKISDVLDYMYYSSESMVTLALKRGDKHIILKFPKNEYDDLGLEFETFLMDKKLSCCNKCVFCFIDQMPPNMRKTLYFKDDDARLSFLQGNYVTLTNLVQKDIDRIIEMKLNINVSVHTTNPELRCLMMHNRFAGEKIAFLRQMADAGISMNCQIVLCPGLNDGDELRRTLTDLGSLMPNVNSVAIVPVGLTKFREGLYPLTLFNEKQQGRLSTLSKASSRSSLKNTVQGWFSPLTNFILLQKDLSMMLISTRNTPSMKTAWECSAHCMMSLSRRLNFPTRQRISGRYPLPQAQPHSGLFQGLRRWLNRSIKT